MLRVSNSEMTEESTVTANRPVLVASVAGYLLFGSSDPYMSSESFKKVGSEMR